MISKKGCFNCAHENPKTGHCNLKGETYGKIDTYLYKGNSEEDIKRRGSSCEEWKRGHDLYEKVINSIKEKVTFT